MLGVLLLGLLIESSVISAERSLLFEEALDEIVRRDLDVAARRADLATAIISKRRSLFSLSPTVSIVGKEYAESQKASNHGHSVEGTTSLNLFRFGADLAAIRSSGDNVRAKESLVNAAVINSEGIGAAALISEIESDRRMSVYSQRVKTQGRLLDIARRRYKHGLLAVQEVNKAVVDLNNARAELRDTEIKALSAAASLQNLLGHARIRRQWPWIERLKTEAKAVDRAQLNVASRPEYQAANSALEAERSYERVLFRKLWPSVDGSVTAGYYGNPSPFRGEWMAALSISVPVFNQFQDYAAYAAQREKVALAKIETERIERTSRAEWEIIRASVRMTVETALGRETNVTISRDLFAESQRRFQSGRASVNDLVVDQTRLLESELLAVEGWSSAHHAWVRFCHARGRRVVTCQE